MMPSASTNGPFDRLETRKEYMRGYLQQYRHSNRLRLQLYGRKWRQQNRDRYLAIKRRSYIRRRDIALAYARKRRLELQKRVFSMLGGCCVACGDADFYHLKLDHIRGKRLCARLERRSATSGTGLYIWLINHPEFTLREAQLLCHNCNQMKSLFPAQFYRHFPQVK